MRRRKSLRSAQKLGKRPFDYPLFFLAILLAFLGVVMVYNASVVEAYRDFGDKFYFARQQLTWAIGGVILMVFLANLPSQLFKKLSVWAFGATLVLLLMVLIPSIGTKTQGARRWIHLGSFSVQPAELAKLTLTMYLAAFLEKKRKLREFIVPLGAVVGLTFLEPDLGTSIVIATTALSIFFLSGASFLELGLTVGAAVLGGMIFIFTSAYRRARVLTFLDPNRDPLNTSYHIRQVLIALGSGGLFGLGIGKSRQKYEYIPEASTDSIFAIIAEELGFVGAVALIGLFVALIARGLIIAKHAASSYSKLLASGIIAWIGIQSLMNFATMVALIPLTGVPLPLISYGGSSTITTLAGLGILLSISREGRDSQ